MFTNKTLKFLCSDLLSFLLNLDRIIVPYYFFNWFPEYRHNLTDRIGLSSEFCLLVLKLFFFFNATFSKLFATHSYTFLCIIHFLFMFSFEILLHPVHFFEEKFQMGLTSWRGGLSFIDFLRERTFYFGGIP